VPGRIPEGASRASGFEVRAANEEFHSASYSGRYNTSVIVL